MPMPGDPLIFTLLPKIILFVFIAVSLIILYNVLRGLKEWQSNNSQPSLYEPVIVSDKRTHVWGGGGHHGHHMHRGRSRTSYYVTFEFEDGERREFMMSGHKYGQIAQGDTGTLTYQGTRFHNFERVQL